MKHLKIEVGELFGGKRLRIAEQTHRNDDFSVSGYIFAASNGFELRSACSPEIVGNEPVLYVRGCEEEKDKTVLTVPSEKWLDKLRIAVQEYNSRFADGEPKIVNGVEVIE